MSFSRLSLIFAAVLCLLCPPLSAETLTHDFTAYGAPTSNITAMISSTATTAMFTYTLSGTAAQFHLHGTQIHACMPNNGNQLVTSGAAEGLTRVRILYYTADNRKLSSDDLQISISEDGSSYTPVSANYNTKGTVDAAMPSTGDYYIKITNVGSTAFYIGSITYYFDSCNCFRVVAE